eukprot:3529455-Rhodomonas_salina.2
MQARRLRLGSSGTCGCTLWRRLRGAPARAWPTTNSSSLTRSPLPLPPPRHPRSLPVIPVIPARVAYICAPLLAGARCAGVGAAAGAGAAA